MSEVYGPVTSLWIGSSLSINICNSDLAKQVLKENDQHLANRSRTPAISLLTNHGKELIWADYGNHYIRLRKFCNMELFSPKSVHSLRPIWEDEISIMVKSIFKDCNPERNSVLRDYLREAAFHIITRIVFGTRFANREGELSEQGKELKAILEDEIKHGASLGILDHIPWLSWIPRLQKSELKKHKGRQDRLARTILEQRRTTTDHQQHFIGSILKQQAEYEFGEETILGLIWDMISAGADTSAISVEWAMAEVIKNKNIQKRIQEELNDVIGLNCIITERETSKLSYLQCIVKEVLRLHPPTPLMLPHKANKNVKIGDYDVPRGSTVHINIWAIARSPENWEDPLEFRPERFLEEDVDVKGHDFRVLPFGSGRRVCPGAALGIDMVTSMFGHLLQNFHWSLPQGVKPEEVDMLERPGLVTYMRTPFQAVATPRLPLHLYQMGNMDRTK